jgi:hypothetical protein
MRRIILVLAVAALMAVLMATTVSPALAAPPPWAGNYGHGTNKDCHGEYSADAVPGCGWAGTRGGT